MARKRKQGPGSILRKTERLEAKKDGYRHSELGTFTGAEVREAMERAWKSPKVNNARYKARWKP